MVKGMKGDPNKCPSFGMPNGPQPEGEPSPEAEENENVKPLTQAQKELIRKKGVDTKVLSFIGLSLAVSEVLFVIFDEEIDPFSLLVWVISSAAYLTCAFMSYMSELDSWVEWPVTSLICLTGTIIPIYLTANYTIDFPYQSTTDKFLYHQVIFGPTAYLLVSCAASKVNDNENKKEEKKTQEHMEKLVEDQKDNMRNLFKKVDPDQIQEAVNAAAKKMSEEEKKDQ